MPEMDGMAATDAIRKRETSTKAPRCRIIALTADAREETIKECVAVGMDGYLTKPLNAGAIQEVLSTSKMN
jgi:CheY-like chemotaxis protein